MKGKTGLKVLKHEVKFERIESNLAFDLQVDMRRLVVGLLVFLLLRVRDPRHSSIFADLPELGLQFSQFPLRQKEGISFLKTN